jgi:enterochelin esterase family protein
MISGWTRAARVAVGLGVAAICAGPHLLAQQSPGPAPAQGGRGGGRGTQAPAFLSPVVEPDRRVTFRIFAPQAQAIRLTASDIPGLGQTGLLKKADNGVWELTFGPIDPGAYRYNFNVDGVAVIDPRNPLISESHNNVWSLVYIPGADFMDTRDVPRGSVSRVTYYSTSLKRFRRMHVYTPPGYESGRDRFPIFYLLHGAGDNDDAWTSVGRAGFILDNLIAARKARPMVVAMPAGHTSQTVGGRGATAAAAPASGGRGTATQDEFIQDFVNDLMPYVEKHYRVSTERQHRAIAGLSMGGSQTLNIAIPHLEKFAYIGVYSSGLLGGGGRGAAPAATVAAPGGAPPPPSAGAAWEQANLEKLDNARLKKGLKLVWFSTGKDDGLIGNTRGTVELLRKHGFDPVFKESPGGHTWINWRNYLHEFAPQLFQ